MKSDKKSNSISWPSRPFHVTPPTVVGGFSLEAIKAQIPPSIPVPTLTPDETELALLKRHYPDADPAQPPWEDIRADLLAAGIPVSTVQEATSRDLVRMAELKHIEQLGVNQQPAAWAAFRINKKTRDDEKSRRHRQRYISDPLSSPKPAAAEENTAENDLTQRESNILEAIGTEIMVGSKIAKAAGYTYNSSFRNTLSNLVKRKHLKKEPRNTGYSRQQTMS